ncbi:MAG: chemotaxis protein CheD [Deltaproteobacteria bacterium]|nr:chemotaxis protein CheD [Deltaproteobacteria bacterium]
MKITVGVADMKVSNDPEAILVTYSLGSCIGIAVYDPAVQVAGILHFMLPDSSLDPVKAKSRPYMFADTGIPPLFKEAYKLGAKKQRMRIIVAGGAQVLDQQGFFNIGKRNHMAVRKIFWKNRAMVSHEDVGGNVNRTVKLAVKDGSCRLKVSGRGELLV